MFFTKNPNLKKYFTKTPNHKIKEIGCGRGGVGV